MTNLFNFFLFLIGFACLLLLFSRMCYEEGMNDDIDEFDSV